MMETFLTSNEWPWRLARTIVQGVLGVVVANVDMLVGCAVLEPEWRAVVVALAYWYVNNHKPSKRRKSFEER